jgi:hypothetical protein
MKELQVRVLVIMLISGRFCAIARTSGWEIVGGDGRHRSYLGILPGSSETLIGKKTTSS